MPLKAGRSKKTRRENVREMVASPTFAPDKPTKKWYEMATAAAWRKSREGLRRGTH